MSATCAIGLASRPKAAAAAALSPNATLAFRELAGDEAITFEEAFSRSFAVPVPRLLELENAPLEAIEITIAVAFDSTAFASTPFLISSRGSKFEVADVQESASGCLSTIVTPHGSEPLAFLVPIRSTVSYPHENIGPIEPVRVTATLADGRVASYAASGSRGSEQASMAGAELGVGWASVDVRDRGRKAAYRVPRVITCTSVGPAPLPTGTAICITIDSRLATPPRLISATIDGRPTAMSAIPSHQDPGSTILTCTTSESVPAHAILELWLEPPVELRTRPPVKGIRYATAGISLPESSRSTLRDTGTTTVVDLSSSAAPLLPGIAVGTI